MDALVMDKCRLQLAQKFASLGMSVFIVEPNSKRPMEGVSWYTQQTTNRDEVPVWFAQLPNCNYGVHPGADYVVIDLDVKPDANGVKAFETLCREHDIDNPLLQIETLIVQSPGGGFHYYFKSPFPCANRNTFADGIDVRGAIGYVVGPGSRDGRGEWRVINDAEIAPLPDFLLGYVKPVGRKSDLRDIPVLEDLDQEIDIERAREWLRDRAPAIERQNGDDHTFATCCQLRDFGLSPVKIYEVLNEGWNQVCDPPWNETELSQKIANAFSYGQNRAGAKAPSYKAQLYTEANKHITPEQIAALARGKDRAADSGDDIQYSRPLSAEELARGDFPRAKHLWRDFLLKGHANSIDGDGGVGKTQVLIQIAVAVASGKALFGNDVIQAPVLLVLCEDEYGEIKHRMEGACAALGVELKDLPIEVWCRPGEDSTLAIVDDNGAWKRGPFYDLLEARLKEIGPCFLGLDTISDVAILDENKRLPVNTFAKQVLGGLCREYGLTALVTRHPSKSSMTDGTYYSGSTAANAAFRNRLLLKAHEKGDGRTLKVAKSNYGLKGEVRLHHSGQVLRSLADLERKQMEEAERGAVLELLNDLRDKGVTVVPSHGNGHKPKDLVPLLREKYGLDVDAKTVLSHLRVLQSNKRVHWLASKPGKNGREATFEIGPLPSAEGERG